MSRVFISYRTKDERFGAAAICEILVERFGAEQVFRDCVSLRPGEHYPTVILDAVTHSDVLLAVVGPDWLTLTDASGLRLIDRRHDWVRKEIATALGRGIPIIPVLLEGAAPLSVADLPRDIHRLALIQATRVSHESFGKDMRQLARRLGDLVPGLRPVVAPDPAARLIDTEPFGRYEPPAPTAPAPAQLPVEIGDFVGRQAQMARLRTMLRATPQHSGPTVIAGPPGVGKTALAIRMARELVGHFPDGQLFVNLRGYDPRLLPTTGGVLTWFLRALGVPTKDVPADETEQSQLFRSLMSGRRALVVLDNAGSPGQVRPLLPYSPTCRVLVTTRDTMGELIVRDGAQLLPLDVLDPREAVDLLTRVVGEPGRVAAEPKAADEIVRLCGHLPMAVRIAGAKLRTRPTWRLDQVVDRLADERNRLNELAVGDVGVRASFALSYDGLPAGHAAAFRRLGLIAGTDFTAVAAGALLGVAVEEAESLLESLFDSHMVDAGGQPGWYRLHDLLRLYALQCTYETDTSDDREKAIRRLLTWYLTTAETANEFLLGAPPAGGPPAGSLIGSRAQALAWLEAERLNLAAAVRQAVDHGLDDLACQIAHALYNFFNLRKYWVDWRSTYQLALSAADRCGNRRARARMLHGLGRVHLDLRRLDRASRCFTEALEIHQEFHDRCGEAHMINDLGIVLGIARRHREAIDHFQRAMTLLVEQGDRRGEANALSNLGGAYLGMPRLNEATNSPRRDVGAAGELSDDATDPTKAIECYERSLAIRREIGDRQGEGESINGLGNANRSLRRFDAAVACYEKALSLCKETGDEHGRGIILSNIGVVYADQQQFARATDYYRRALGIYQRLGHRSSIAMILSNLGTVHVSRRQWPIAVAYYRQSLAVFVAVHDHLGEAQTRVRIAETVERYGDS
jgi:tetratricopeptide (TPR) repeat protein